MRGIVQGVGFRPFVQRLAARLEVAGFVRNVAGGVEIEVEGHPGALDAFLAALRAEAPAPAHVDAIAWRATSPRGEVAFSIAPSPPPAARTHAPLGLGPDVATCGACLGEVLDPRDRRHRYAFTSCAGCGPRWTIATATPYDRARTSMAPFAMCSRCSREHAAPDDRRLHAQANACPACGPALTVLDAGGAGERVADPLRHAGERLRQGRIVAVKGLGGYHLVCDATQASAVAELRRRKRREAKPLALMVADVGAARRLAHVSEDEAQLLLGPERPIVLLRRRADAPVADEVAPGNAYLGLMLPYTPLHHLLLLELGGAPLVVTSGNEREGPIAFEDADARTRLAAMADVFVTHDRDITIGCDDSVARVARGRPLLLRRSRGHAPRPVQLPLRCARPILALGGHLKATFALGVDDQAWPSQHLGDLEDRAAVRAYAAAVAHHERMLGVRPALVVHDSHPGYATTAYAAERGLERVAVQHHHAHMASCLAEHGLTGPALGVTFDGSGLGEDGTPWGGEFLVGDLARVRRAAHLRAVPLPGGDVAAREPWRLAVAHLVDAGLGDRVEALLAGRIPSTALRVVRRMVERRVQAPMTTSAGRLFDAVAALAGVRDTASFEGQAALELEGLAAAGSAGEPYPFALADDDGGAVVVDTRPLVRAVVADLERGAGAVTVARRFHDTLAEVIAATCARLSTGTGLRDVALSGGVFQNVVLTEAACERLLARGLLPRTHEQVPPNDGGLALGQLAVAAAREERR